MTVYGWDASHFDGTLTREHLALARAEGVQFFTHKIGEGLADTEGTHDDTALAAARAAGIPVLGGYLVPRSAPSVAAQVKLWISLADAGEPWWREHPHWIWQIDLERWPYDAVPASVGIAAARELRARTGRWTILYASHGQYGDQLAGWDGPLWNADYTGHAAGSAAAMYPGDDWRPVHGGWTGGWAPYSGREPTLLQFTSSATIAGLSTCDANAFRGSLQELLTLIGGNMTNLGYSDVDGQYLCAREEAVVGLIPVRMGPETGRALPFVEAVKRIDTGVAGLTATVTALTAAVHALAAGGTSIDTAAVLAAVAAAGQTESAAVSALHDQVAALHAQLAAGAQAEAAALAAQG